MARVVYQMKDNLVLICIGIETGFENQHTTTLLIVGQLVCQVNNVFYSSVTESC